MLSYHDIPLDSGAANMCRRCVPGDPGPAPMAQAPRDVAEVESAISRVLDAAPGPGLLFTGSSPLAHPGFDRVARSAIRAGVRRLGVRARGESLADPQAVRSALDSGLRLFEIPVLGSRAEAHDRLVQENGSFEAARSAIAQIREASNESGLRVSVRGRVGVCAHTADDLPSIVMRLAEWGVTDVVLACDGGSQCTRHIEWVAAACDTGTVNRVWVSLEGVAPELLGERALHGVGVLSLAAGDHP